SPSWRPTPHLRLQCRHNRSSRLHWRPGWTPVVVINCLRCVLSFQSIHPPQIPKPEVGITALLFRSPFAADSSPLMTSTSQFFMASENNLDSSIQRLRAQALHNPDERRLLGLTELYQRTVHVVGFARLS